MMTHGSLFSGIGGFDLAAEWMGWRNLFHVEISDFCRTILQYYWPGAVSYEDIRTTDFTVWKGKIDILTGGFPCQPFSIAGLQRGDKDERYLQSSGCTGATGYGLWPTPKARDRGFKKTIAGGKVIFLAEKMRQEKMSINCHRVSESIIDYSIYHGKISQEKDGIQLKLSPQFLEGMMGYPKDWTIAPFEGGAANPLKGSGMP